MKYCLSVAAGFLALMLVAVTFSTPSLALDFDTALHDIEPVHEFVLDVGDPPDGDRTDTLTGVTVLSFNNGDIDGGSRVMYADNASSMKGGGAIGASIG